MGAWDSIEEVRYFYRSDKIEYTIGLLLHMVERKILDNHLDPDLYETTICVTKQTLDALTIPTTSNLHFNYCPNKDAVEYHGYPLKVDYTLTRSAMRFHDIYAVRFHDIYAVKVIARYKQPDYMTKYIGIPIQNQSCLNIELVRERLKENNMPEIVDVIFNEPSTIVRWKDGTKTVVKCGKRDNYDKEKGLAMCIVKKINGNKGNFNNLFKKWVK